MFKFMKACDRDVCAIYDIDVIFICCDSINDELLDLKLIHTNYRVDDIIQIKKNVVMRFTTNVKDDVYEVDCDEFSKLLIKLSHFRKTCLNHLNVHLKCKFCKRDYDQCHECS